MNVPIQKRMNINMFLLALVLCIGELHQLFDRPINDVRPFLFRPNFQFTLGMGWYVKLFTWFLQDVIKAVVILRLSRLHTRMRVAARAYLILTICGLLIYVLFYSAPVYFMSLLYPLSGIIMMIAVAVDDRGGISFHPFQSISQKAQTYRKWLKTALSKRRKKLSLPHHRTHLDLTENFYHEQLT